MVLTVIFLSEAPPWMTPECDAMVVAVDTVMGATAMLVEDPSVTATVLDGMFAPCSNRLVVTPLPMITVHSEFAPSVAVAAVSVNVAVDNPDSVAAALNVVVPHPLDVLRPAGVPNMNVGSIKAKLSATLRGEFSSNVYDSEK